MLEQLTGVIFNEYSLISRMVWKKLLRDILVKSFSVAHQTVANNVSIFELLIRDMISCTAKQCFNLYSPLKCNTTVHK